jgi:hypothetical protein
VGRVSRWLGRKTPSPEELCAEELWAAYEKILPECRSMIVEPAVQWTAEMERPPVEFDDSVLRRDLIFYICFLSTVHCQEFLSDWRPFLDHLHARALATLPEGALEKLNASYGEYTEAFEEGMGRNWHAVNRLFIARLQALMGDIPRLLWSGATFAMLDLTRQAAKEILHQLPGKATGEVCPACGLAGHLERVAFGDAGAVVVCNACLTHPHVKEKLIGDFAALFALVERGNSEAPKLIRQLAARHRMSDPEIILTTPTEGDGPEESA